MLLYPFVEATGEQGYEKAEVKNGWGYRPRKEGAEDNPLLVAGVYSKDVAYDSDPQMSDTSWAERAYIYGAAEARHPPFEPHSEESDADSGVTGARELSRYAQPVLVGAADLPDTAAEESIEEDEATEEPTYTYAQGYGRFAIRYTGLATALGNFEQGNAQTEIAVFFSTSTDAMWAVCPGHR